MPLATQDGLAYERVKAAIAYKRQDRTWPRSMTGVFHFIRLTVASRMLLSHKRQIVTQAATDAAGPTMITHVPPLKWFSVSSHKKGPLATKPGSTALAQIAYAVEQPPLLDSVVSGHRL